MYVTPEHTYDFKKLAEVTRVIVRNLNKIIDINYYPVPEVRRGADSSRVGGAGVTGSSAWSACGTGSGWPSGCYSCGPRDSVQPTRVDSLCEW